MNYNFKQLEAFVALVECGSFTAAAEKLYLAQSTVSGHLAALEKDMGVPLLARTGKRKIVLTEKGRRVYAHAKAILQSCDQLSKEIEEDTSVELVLAASSIPLGYMLPELMAGFKQVMPQCRFSLLGGDSMRVYDQVLDGDVQLGFVGMVLNRKELHYDLLREDKLVLLTPDNDRYRTLLKSGICGNDLLSEPLIIRENGSGTQQAADRFFCENRIQTENIQIAARMDNNDAIMRAVSQGLGTAIVSELAAGTARNVLTFPLIGESTARCLYMIYPRGRRLANTAEVFRDFVLKQYEE